VSGRSETGIHALAISPVDLATGPGATLASSTTTTLSKPDVDGWAGRWVATWEQGGNRIQVVPISLTVGPIFTTLSPGTIATFGGTSSSQLSSPTIGYTPAKSWLGHRASTILIGSQTLRAMGLDSMTCTSCNDTFSRSIAGTEDHLVVATMTSGGVPAGNSALAVWRESTNIYAQRLTSSSQNGTLQDIGGRCGIGGTQSFTGTPAIGNNNLHCSVDGLSGTATISVFNFNAPGLGVNCGACVWVPFGGTQIRLVALGHAGASLVIPCLSSLVGSSYETQWTTLDDSQAPCSLLPGVVVSERVLHVIGS
jgi:hypothetical protein